MSSDILTQTAAVLLDSYFNMLYKHIYNKLHHVTGYHNIHTLLHSPFHYLLICTPIQALISYTKVPPTGCAMRYYLRNAQCSTASSTLAHTSVNTVNIITAVSLPRLSNSKSTHDLVTMDAMVTRA